MNIIKITDKLENGKERSDNVTAYEITVRIYLSESIKSSNIQAEIVKFVDTYLGNEKKFAEYHEEKTPKCYTMDLLYPIERGGGEYEGGNLYQFRIRTVSEELASYLLSGIADHKTDQMKGLARTVKTIPHRHISSVYTLTPIVLIDSEERGYWRDCMSFPAFEEMLKKSIVHQYEMFTGEQVDQDCPLYDQIELKNKGPIGVPYKGITLLCDKVSLQVSDNETAQKVFYYLLGSGIGTKGSRGFGFLGYRFL